MLKRMTPPAFMIALLCSGCFKTPLPIEENVQTYDPDIVYLDNYKIDLATYKTDSFVTSGHNVFMVGTHTDSAVTKMSTDAYLEVELPSVNPVKDRAVLFDSLVIKLNTTGNYYGDTLLAYRLNIFRLTQNIENDDEADSIFFYPRRFSREAGPMAQVNMMIKPVRKKEFTVRLPDSLGIAWMQKLKNDHDDIQSQYNFRNYFKGLCLATDSSFNQNLFFFTTGSDKNIIELHYREQNAISTAKVLSFPYRSTRQFNNIQFNHAGLFFSSFNLFRKQLRSSAATGGKAVVSNFIPSFAKITFPDLLSVKELHPYLKIVKATLEIKPSGQTAHYPYKLPPQLTMHVSNGDNRFDGVLSDLTGQQQQTGNLAIDDLYGRETKYSFDVTQYINQLLSEGNYSNKALFLGVAVGKGDTDAQRLIINSENGSSGIKLKLYVLGL